jgi:hypothetical protein
MGKEVNSIIPEYLEKVCKVLVYPEKNTSAKDDKLIPSANGRAYPASVFQAIWSQEHYKGFLDYSHRDENLSRLKHLLSMPLTELPLLLNSSEWWELVIIKSRLEVGR